MRRSKGVDADKPPEHLRALFKIWQKRSLREIQASSDIFDLSHEDCVRKLAQTDYFSSRQSDIGTAVQRFLKEHEADSGPAIDTQLDLTTFEIQTIPGLYLFPSLLTQDVQIVLLDRLLHRDLSNPAHNTNIHLFHHVTYPVGVETGQARPASFFAIESEQQLLPKDASVHKPMTIERMLQRKLRWMTLGGQYDWTAKIYPDEQPPNFPPDIAQLLRAYFPDVQAQAAIVNFYSPGDTLSVHRDVSEDCDRGLISISIGCDAIFMIGNDDGSKHATIRVRSGDAVLMTGQSRFAWHAVPKVLASTCPEWLHTWPATTNDSMYELWRGWMKTKRININVRQIRDSQGENVKPL